MSQPMFITFTDFYLLLGLAFTVGYMVGHRGAIFAWLMDLADSLTGGPGPLEVEEVPFSSLRAEEERAGAMERHPSGRSRMMRLVGEPSWDPDDPADPYR